MHRLIGLGLLHRITLAFVMLFCAAKARSAETPRPSQWEATIEAAKKEGKVNIYLYRYGKVLDVFRSEYPEIRPYLLTGTGAQITTKILTERRAGRYLADVIGLGSSNYRILHQQAKMLDPIQSALMLPEVLDTSRWYGGKHRYLDAENKFVFAYLANASSGQLYYNTTQVNAREFTSYYDLFKPKWKGKIVMLDPRPRTEVGTTMQFFHYNPELGPGFIRQLFGAKEVTFSRDSRQMIDWLGQGRFSICFGCSGALKAKNQGLPIEIFDTSLWKEGASFSVGGGTLSTPSQAPHPNAAKVFINWYLSRRGQSVLQKIGDPDEPPNSARIDIPKDEIQVHNKLIEGRKYFDASRPEFEDVDSAFKIAVQAMEAR
ncbi:MAG TPA: extracellular solute-binding protein [Candidatus Limnocylindrales bacterium]|nr:extracellular solute-binding protein [Candidatus Limnocylindrales bacterium]